MIAPVRRRNSGEPSRQGPRNDGERIYVSRDVFHSKVPFVWRYEDRVGHVRSHAAEVVCGKDGKWYVSTCGWGQGGVYLAPLIWKDELDGAPSSMPVPE